MCRRGPPEDGPGPGRLGELAVGHRVELRPGDQLQGRPEPGLQGQCGDGPWVVAGDDLQVDPRVGQGTQGGQGVRSELVAHRHQGQRGQTLRCV